MALADQLIVIICVQVKSVVVREGGNLKLSNIRRQHKIKSRMMLETLLGDGFRFPEGGILMSLQALKEEMRSTSQTNIESAVA